MPTRKRSNGEMSSMSAMESTNVATKMERPDVNTMKMGRAKSIAI